MPETNIIAKLYTQGIPGAAQPVGLYSSFTIASEGFTIPTSDGVTVPMVDANYLVNGGSLPVIINGIQGTLSRSGSTYTFTRLGSGSTSAVAANTTGHSLGVASFAAFGDRPTTLSTNDAGKTYFFSKTGNIHSWTGTAWDIWGSDVNLLDYGAAIGADISAAVAAAVAAGKRRGYLPRGTYLLSTSLSVAGSYHLYGDGVDETIIDASASAVGTHLAFTGGTRVALPALVSPATIDSTAITLASAPSLVAGDVIILSNEDSYSFHGARDYYRGGRWRSSPV